MDSPGSIAPTTEVFTPGIFKRYTECPLIQPLKVAWTPI
jgi:hypothetical protein